MQTADTSKYYVSLYCYGASLPPGGWEAHCSSLHTDKPAKGYSYVTPSLKKNTLLSRVCTISSPPLDSESTIRKMTLQATRHDPNRPWTQQNLRDHLEKHHNTRDLNTNQISNKHFAPVITVSIKVCDDINHLLLYNKHKVKKTNDFFLLKWGFLLCIERRLLQFEIELKVHQRSSQVQNGTYHACIKT